MKKIRIVSPAKHIDQLSVDFTLELLRLNGFNVEIGTYALGQHHYFSGSLEERLSDFQYALDDPTVDIILCARGGYGSVQLIDKLDFSKFQKNPKFIVGYSDITVFHCHVSTKLNSSTVHGTAPLNFSKNTNEAIQSLLNVFNGIKNSYKIAAHSNNILGTITAPVIGGNLSILYSLLGTNSDADYRGKILFIEEIGEAIYAIDRMFYALKKAGKLNQIKGVIVGGLTNIKDSEIPYGKTVQEVIKSHIEPLSIPLCFNFPAGHIADNRAIIMGRNTILEIRENKTIFIQS